MWTVNPRVAVISVQHDSRFGHPYPVLLERYQALGARVLHTEEQGAITVHNDGQSVWIQPYIGESVVLSAPVTHRMAETLTPPATGAE